MPRRDFQTDLAQVCVPGVVPRLTHVRCGAEDGSFYFTCHAIDFRATVIEPSEYPRDHYYFVFAVTEDISYAVTEIVENSPSTFQGLPVQEFLTAISGYLDATIKAEDDDEQGYEDMDCDEGADKPFHSPESDINVNDGIRTDLRNARNSGYRVGLLGDLKGPVILSASRRISKLGISRDVMEAWRVCPSDYLVLLVRYPHGYHTLPDVIGNKRWPGSSLVQFYAGVCKSYKPSLDSAQRLFALADPSGAHESVTASNMERTEPILNPIFFGKSLQSLLNSRFVDILKSRLKYKFTWTGAELYLNNGQGKLTDDGEIDDSEYFKPDTWRVPPPVFLAEDHLASTNEVSDMSLLLVAMQFTLRRFVKCTEFCLNCYCKIEAGFEALKPFVCPKELCLYQYMALGMGPNLEWEISSQPYVVDLLVSFAYARAFGRKLDDFPTNTQLRVPHPARRESLSNENPSSDVYNGHFTFRRGSEPCLHLKNCTNIKEGDWVAIMMASEFHARVKDTSEWPKILLSDLIFKGQPLQEEQKRTLVLAGDVSFAIHDTCIDSLQTDAKLGVLVGLLDMLPNVSEMKEFIDHKKGGHLRSLSQWQDRIHPSALYVLQWIIGSNRSVIMYDDNPQHQVSGMEGYIQFRFAQGAPDKEQRFVTSVNNTASRLGLKYPTLFAWHGSPLCNWHSIVRESLHYKETAHGRSYGDGIYMAMDFHTSHSFSGSNSGFQTSSWQWPNSEMKCVLAISLNEVVNAPSEFRCKNPYYVVQNVDWVQPRYLFVHCQTKPSSLGGIQRQTLKSVYTQDPERKSKGPSGGYLQIPISATNSHRSTPTRQSQQQVGSHHIDRHGIKTYTTKDGADDDDADSVATLPEDNFLLLSDSETNANHSHDIATNFDPKRFDPASVQLLGAPSYATSNGARSLRKLLREALKTQRSSPLHELSWYIHGNIIDNMYQWIVELHSFKKHLKIAKDLEKAGLTSIVLEIRFPAVFPLEPPFIRVIRPRFVRFSNGGGGHITAGGAMCMELLTNTAWLPTLSIENVLMQVNLAISSEHPRPAKLDFQYLGHDYNVGDAIAEYKRVCIAHGWKVPADIDRMQWS
ncbi:hypothetical protein BJX99DRAFT_45041 [Aspergillus californicus]